MNRREFLARVPAIASVPALLSLPAVARAHPEPTMKIVGQWHGPWVIRVEYKNGQGQWQSYTTIVDSLDTGEIRIILPEY